MATPQQSFSFYSHTSNPSHRNIDSSRFAPSSTGRGHNDSRRGRFNRNYARRGFTQVGRLNRSNDTRPTNDEHGDMKTGLYKDSFLEDPWKDLVQSTRRSAKPKTYEDQASAAIKNDGHQDPLADNEEGEIVLSEDEDEDDDLRLSTVGLGDGIVEAAREVS
jgi:hypothetical protein